MLIEHLLCTHQALCWGHRFSCERTDKVPVLTASTVVDEPGNKPGSLARKLVNRPAKVPGRAWTLQDVGQCGRDRATVGRAVAAFPGKGPAHQ